MTDKEQIIIDGVCINTCLVSEKCKEFKTCKMKNILKQLTRKTQECEKLTNKNNLLIAELNQIKLLLEGKNTQYNVKVEEGEKYKKLAAAFKDVNKQLGYKYLTIKKECEELKEKYEEVKEDRYNLNMEMYTLNRYRKALKEIEEIVTKDYYEDNWAGITIKIDSIRNIINKVKGGGND